MPGSNPGSEDVGYLRRQAERCARLAGTVNDCRAREELERMAGEFEALARRALPPTANASGEDSVAASADDTRDRRMLYFL
ncbi:MAG TPA: hypothetical protein VN668_05675 [Stellaceae bacterium]|nr:hypothetical protein [Stellaceae bacterium]